MKQILYQYTLFSRNFVKETEYCLLPFALDLKVNYYTKKTCFNFNIITCNNFHLMCNT